MIVMTVIVVIIFVLIIRSIKKKRESNKINVIEGEIIDITLTDDQLLYEEQELEEYTNSSIIDDGDDEIHEIDYYD